MVIVRMDMAEHGPGARVTVEAVDGSGCVGDLCTMPMYDEERLIPRGKLVDIPVRPAAAE